MGVEPRGITAPLASSVEHATQISCEVVGCTYIYIDGSLRMDYAPWWCKTKAVGCCIPVRTSTSLVDGHETQLSMGED